MPNCEFPACSREATHGAHCYGHYRLVGTTSKVDKEVVDEKQRQKLFRQARKEYISEHPQCEYKDCQARASEVHHKRGRVGKLLYDIKHFMSLCWKHHKEIEADPKKAKANGYSESRLSK